MARGSRKVRASRWVAPPNIALVKYWGVRDPELGLPYNSSLSVTLDRFRSTTTVTFDPTLPEDAFELDGQPATGGPYEDVHRMLDRIRSAARLKDRAGVVSSNNFPTASGLASSASGFAALTGAAATAAGLRGGRKRLSQIARFGSGSACRSFFGGFVEWRAGRRDDGSDCYARPLFGEGHWRELRDEVLIIADAPRKAVRSSVAMQRSVATAPGYFDRVRQVPERMRGMKRAIRDRDAPRLFDLLMEECDNFREVCETTSPPLEYLTPTSREVLERVRGLNRAAGTAVVGYTHDAGAHLHLFVLDGDRPQLGRALRGQRGILRRIGLRPGPGAGPA